jgi:hypothetical protein
VKGRRFRRHNAVTGAVVQLKNKKSLQPVFITKERVEIFHRPKRRWTMK